MRRLFVMTHQFDRQWQAMGLTDPDLVRLQQGILENPQIGLSYLAQDGCASYVLPLKGKAKEEASA